MNPMLGFHEYGLKLLAGWLGGVVSIDIIDVNRHNIPAAAPIRKLTGWLAGWRPPGWLAGGV